MAMVFSIFEVEEVVAEEEIEAPLFAEEGGVFALGAENVVVFWDEVGEVVSGNPGHVGGVGGITGGEAFGNLVGEETIAFPKGEGFDALGEVLEFFGSFAEPFTGKPVSFVGIFFSEADDFIHVGVVVGVAGVDVIDVDFATSKVFEADGVSGVDTAFVLFLPEAVEEDGVAGGSDAVFFEFFGCEFAGFFVFVVPLGVLLALFGGHFKIASHFEVDTSWWPVFCDDSVDYFTEFMEGAKDEGIVDVGEIGIVVIQLWVCEFGEQGQLFKETV